MNDDTASGGRTTRFRFVSWNVNWRATAAQRRAQAEFVRSLAPDLLALQEVKATTLRPFEDQFAWKAFALGPNPADRAWSSRIGTAVLGTDRFELRGSMLVAPTWFELPDDEDTRWKANRFSRRATWTSVRATNGGTFLVGSLHASPAAGDIQEHKPWFHAGIARWLANTDEPWLFGIDANTPATDPFDATATRWCWPQTPQRPGEDELLGTATAHRGKDLYRSWLALHPHEIERIQQTFPNGPLAVSYNLRSGPVRYDHCWATREIHTHHIHYVQEAFQYSDHAAIVADLSFHPTGEQPLRIPIDDTEWDGMHRPRDRITNADLEALWSDAHDRTRPAEQRAKLGTGPSLRGVKTGLRPNAAPTSPPRHRGIRHEYKPDPRSP